MGKTSALGLGCSFLFCLFAASPLCLAARWNLFELKEQKSLSTHSFDSSSCQNPSHGGSHGSGRQHGHDGGHNGNSGSGNGNNRGDCTCNTAPPITPVSPHVPLPPNSSMPNPRVPVNPPIVITPSPPYVVPFNPPSIRTPSPPFIPDPNSAPFTCYYWFTHPTSIWILFGYWGSIGQVFSMPSSVSLPYGRSLTLLQALGNTRGDGFGLLLREGTASLLNSMASRTFYFDTQQVKDGFNDAIRSEKMAEAQGKIFQKANQGHLKH